MARNGQWSGPLTVHWVTGLQSVTCTGRLLCSAGNLWKLRGKRGPWGWGRCEGYRARVVPVGGRRKEGAASRRVALCPGCPREACAGGGRTLSLSLVMPTGRGKAGPEVRAAPASQSPATARAATPRRSERSRPGVWVLGRPRNSGSGNGTPFPMGVCLYPQTDSWLSQYTVGMAQAPVSFGRIISDGWDFGYRTWSPEPQLGVTVLWRLWLCLASRTVAGIRGVGGFSP